MATHAELEVLVDEIRNISKVARKLRININERMLFPVNEFNEAATIKRHLSTVIDATCEASRTAANMRNRAKGKEEQEKNTALHGND